jgi:ubiquinone/menaquinone biosynthesis C-methylase UbiE
MLKQYSFYALVWDLGSALNGHMAEARQYIEELKFDKTKDIRVLGCGVGTGIFEMEVLRQFPRAHVTAIDLNQQMLDVFKRKTASSAFQGRVNSLQGDLGNVLDSLSQTAYDLAIAGAVFEHIEDPSDILKKIHSLLEEDGVFFISSLRQTLAGRFIGFCCGVRLPDFHDHWINSCFVMLQEKSDASGALPIIVQSFPGSTPAVQREIIMSVFRTLVLKDRKLATSLKTPFSFLGETEAVSSLEQESFNQQALQEQMA